MLRESLKFRGKSANGEWLYGNVAVMSPLADNVPQLAYINGHQVDPDSVGQFSGMYDKNGEEIYEGDILVKPRVYRGLQPIDNKCTVIWHEGGLHIQEDLASEPYPIGTYHTTRLRIIGNVHE